MSGESDAEEKVPDEEQDLQDKILSGEFRWMSSTHRTDPGEGTGFVAVETIAVSKRSISLLPQKEVVRTDLQPFKQET